MISKWLVDLERYPLVGNSGTELQAAFNRDHYVRFPAFFSDGGYAGLLAEAQRLAKNAVRRDMRMAATDDSPRYMSTLGGESIRELSTVIPLFYQDASLLNFLSNVTGKKIIPVADRYEDIVLNHQHRAGDTHGVHYDDYLLALVAVIEAPPPGGGGMLEMVPNSTSLSDIEGQNVIVHEHAPGDCYLMKSDTTAHRVTPLNRDFRRTTLACAYATIDFTPVKTDTSAILYARGWSGPDRRTTQRPPE
jgi:hypothetical protein